MVAYMPTDMNQYAILILRTTLLISAFAIRDVSIVASLWTWMDEHHYFNRSSVG
jgi:hypothetical protein